MIGRSSLLAALVLLLAWNAKAQVESAPQEPPFVQEDSEFDESLRIEDEIMSAEPNQPVPPPPAKKSVNLNEDVPEAGSAWEDDVNQIGSDVVEDTQYEDEPVVAAPVYTEPVVVKKSAKGGTEYIHHPQAAKGLMRIEKDGSYIYRTEEDKKFSQTGSFRMGVMEAPRIMASDGVTTFKTMYTKGPVPVLSFDFEWRPYDWMGKNLHVQAGFGLIIAQGKGRFLNPAQTLIPKEEYTFAAVPIYAGGVYRLQWKDRQAVAPFVTAGGTYYPVLEFRDDGESPNGVGTPGAYGGGGLMFNIGSLDRDTAFSLTTEYGIKNLWLVLELRYVATFAEDLDFTGALANIGFTTDF